jgi:hypothetical protein
MIAVCIGSDPLIFHDVMTLEHRKKLFRTFFSLLTDIHSIFVSLICHTNIQIKRDLCIIILVEKEVSHNWKYGYQQYNAYS